jgi:hypothetical protein
MLLRTTIHKNTRHSDQVEFEDTNAVINRVSGDLEIRTYAGYDINLMPAGNVGIGTVSPQKNLDITKAGNATFQMKGTGTNNYAGAQLSLFAGTTSNVFNSVMFAMDRRTDGVGGIYLQRRDSSHAYKGNLFRYLDIDGWTFSTASSTTATGVADHLRINSSGNVGIGTNSPGNKLEVRGDIAVAISDTQDIIKLSDAGNDGSIEIYTGEATPTLRTKIVSYGDTYFNAASTGRVGIGTTSPDAKLEVTGSTNTDLFSLEGAGSNFKLIAESGDATSSNVMVYRLSLDYLSGTATNGFIDFYRGPDGATGFLSFGTSGTERMRINRTGCIKVGPNGGDTAHTFEIDTSGNENHGLFINADNARGTGDYALYIDDEDPKLKVAILD